MELLLNIMKKIYSILILLFFVGCATTKPNIITPKEEIKITLRDSVVIKDSVVITPIERIVDIVPQYDTLHLQTSLAKSKAWVDTTTHSLRGEIINKEQTQNKNRIEVKYINRVDSVVIEKPIPYEVIKEIKYVPKAYQYSMGFSIVALLFIIGFIIWKIRRLFI